ncbi:hypothetical protein COY95_02865 [Candidatus Woesearchaeota archaeon CG_4_10_14_0_8_um_filter_47_5]|nr:MAG: hypothetical protein COY95_02865 [Candidatus Woesearchaeota archaeon CG_4_10_14_0_8_um_filter_47_5]
MAKKVKVIFRKEPCIGCRACNSVCDKYWGFEDDESKAVLKGSTETEPGLFVLELDEPDCNEQAKGVCPAECIDVLK